MHSSRPRLAAVRALLASGLLAASAPAVGQVAEPRLYEFGEIVVTGELPRVVEEVTSVEVVTAEEIERSGARTVAEAIALLPGLHVRRGAEGIPLIDVRGLRTRNVLLLLDGVPLNSSFDGVFDPASLSVENVAEIKLTRGASSMLYGPGGNAGVLNIVTRAAADVPEAALVVEQGFSESSSLRARASARRGDLGIVVAGSLFEEDYFELASDFEPTPIEDGGRRLASDREDASAFASMTYDAAPQTRFGLNLNYRTGERGKPPVTVDNRRSDFAPRARFERVDYDALSLHAALTHDAGPRLTLRPALYFNQSDDLTDAFDDRTFSTQDAAGAFSEDATTSIFGGGLQLAFNHGSHALATLAVDLREERWDAAGFTVVGVTGGGGGGGGGDGGGGGGGGGRVSPVPFDDERSVWVGSLALEYELSADGPFSAVLGAGYSAQSRDEVATEDGLSFLAGGTWALGSETALRASVARRIRFPTLRDLYGADRGNPELEAERTLGYEVGIERTSATGGRRLELTLFRIDADDFIQRTPGDILGNIQETRLQGIELAGHHRPTRDGRLKWSYTYLDAENRSPDADVTTLQNQPEHRATLAAEHVMPIGLTVRGDLLWVADQFALSRSRPTRTLDLGDYAVVGLRLAQELAGGRLRLIGRVANLLDEDYVEAIGFPAPGRTVFVGFELRAGR